MCQLLTWIIPFKQGAFIDVSVNVGQTLIKLRKVNKEIEYIGFEPNPNNVSYTQELIRINEFSHCRLVTVGLFDKDTIPELNFFHESISDDTASLIKTIRPGQKIIRIIYIPLTSLKLLNRV